MTQALTFQKAVKRRNRGKIALTGPSGSGKTYTALRLAMAMAGPKGRVAVIDSEHGSASKYQGDPNPDGGTFEFDVLELGDFAPQAYVAAIRIAEQTGYDVVIVDSLSHAWMGKGGALQQVDRITERTGQSFQAWAKVTPVHQELIDTLVGCRCHLIATMRSKTEYVLEKNDKGKTVPRKIGLAPVQRDGMEYEFDVTADLDLKNNLSISKTRCSALVEGYFEKPGRAMAEIFMAWLSGGADVPAPASQPAPLPGPAAKAAAIQGAGGGNGSRTATLAGQLSARAKMVQEIVPLCHELTDGDGDAALRVFHKTVKELCHRDCSDMKLKETETPLVHGRLMALVLAKRNAADAAGVMQGEDDDTIPFDGTGREPGEDAGADEPPLGPPSPQPDPADKLLNEDGSETAGAKAKRGGSMAEQGAAVTAESTPAAKPAAPALPPPPETSASFPATLKMASAEIAAMVGWLALAKGVKTANVWDTLFVSSGMARRDPMLAMAAKDDRKKLWIAASKAMAEMSGLFEAATR